MKSQPGNWSSLSAPLRYDLRSQKVDGAPLYLRVKQLLEQKITSGEIRKGDSLPSETELCRLFSVSSITIRRALLELTQDGLIRRRPGLGTIVTSATKRIKFSIVFVGFDDSIWAERAEIFGSLLAGIGDVAWHANADFSTIRISSDEDASSIFKSLIDEQRTDGLLLRTAGDVKEEHLMLLESCGMPYVSIKRRLEDRAMNFVTMDDYSSAFRMTEHLIKLGHHKIGLITGAPDISPRRDIYQGYKRALELHGISSDKPLVQAVPGAVLPGEDDGFTAMQQLLSLDDRPTAVCVYSDSMIFGAINAITEAGLAIPTDVAVVGYGSIQAAMRMIRPRLTAIDTPYEEIGRRAAETLFQLIHQPETAPQEVFIKPPLLVQESCGAYQVTKGCMT